METDIELPDLTFPDVEYGANETPWNLHVLLYEGGAKARANLVEQLIASGALGYPQLARLELATRLHEEIRTDLAGGGSRETAKSRILCLRYLFKFAEKKRHPLTLETFTETYCAWADWLLHRTRVKKRTPTDLRNSAARHISMNSAYSYAAIVGNLLDRIFERHTSVLELTRLEHKGHRKSAVGVQAEKQNLSDTFAFGHVLQDICDGLPLHTVLEAPLPIAIELRSGKTLTRHGHRSDLEMIAQESRLGERYPLANLRMEAELLMLIGQTGMNSTQALNLEMRQFSYDSFLDGYRVRDYKNRRGGNVVFEIYVEYRPHFERYLEWRRTLFPESNRLFPFIGKHGSRLEQRFSGQRLRKICKELGIRFVSPKSLRNTRVNWLLRQTADTEVTAEMSQHLQETLVTVYTRPSLQRAMVEATAFWSNADPHLVKLQAVAPGVCKGVPEETADAPKDVPKPDCETASGCLWCKHHRDVDSFDYVWGLTSFNYLKVIELSKARLPQSDQPVHPAKRVIDRILEKLRWFEQSNDARCSWVQEAQARINEGDFHPDWQDIILELEGTA